MTEAVWGTVRARRAVPRPEVGGDFTATVVAVLRAYADGPTEAPNRCNFDGGAVQLAALAQPDLPPELIQPVLRRWLGEIPARLTAVGSFGGLGGFLAAARAGAQLDPRIKPLVDTILQQSEDWLSQVHWQSSAVAWQDYDLFHGPAGLLLAGAVPGTSRILRPAALHLRTLCAGADLDGMRAGSDIDPRSAFNIGRINTGMGHGVTGVAAALRHVVEIFDDGEEYLGALGNACQWLINEAYLAQHDFITWPPIGRDGAPPSRTCDDRQAWCYGTPGVAWTLWDCGRVLADPAMQLLGLAAMRSFCRIFDEQRHLDHGEPSAELGICHGAAGTLAVADAFARHAGLSEAAELRYRLERYLLNRIYDIETIACNDMSILSGAGGILAVLLTSQGADRGWLSQLALR